MIREYLKNNILLCDGAMGTYYYELTGNDISYCELANLNDKETIAGIHKNYIKAGAKLIRTNTFSANTRDLKVSLEELKEIIYSAIDIAEKAVGNRQVFIGASIGPIRTYGVEEDENSILDEYKYIADCFLSKNINIFIFETFSNCKYLNDISSYIKSKDKESFILTQFAVKPDGFTRDGISAHKLIDEVKSIKDIDAYGFNCGSGPAHVYNLLKNIDIDGDIVSALPNAGFPQVIHERTVYPNNPYYFAKRVSDMRRLGVSIVGGCCGTNPRCILELNNALSKNNISHNEESKEIIKADSYRIKNKNTFKKKLQNGDFVTVVELSSPIDTDISKLMQGAEKCKENNIDMVTIPDSPMSRVRAESTIIASKIRREIGIEVMPHICCRDKNTNAIRSSLLGSYIEDIRNILAITGDPLSDASKIESKSVFNLNSFKLIELINQMNSEAFSREKILVGGALNLNVKNKEVELERLIKKVEKGASFFLTQPIFDDDAIEFLKKIKEENDIKILAGIMPIVSYKNALFLNNELPGVTIPEKYIKMFSPDMTREEGQKIGIRIAVDIGKRVRDICDGLYLITPFNRVDMLMNIVEKIKQ